MKFQKDSFSIIDPGCTSTAEVFSIFDLNQLKQVFDIIQAASGIISRRFFCENPILDEEKGKRKEKVGNLWMQ